MATTHYSELKVYALSTPGVENACCEFNVETLSPTYRLLIGIPGKSNAFAISSKLGLAANIIDDAKSRLSDKDVDFEDMLANLEASRITIEKEQLEIKKYKAEVENLKKKLIEYTAENAVYSILSPEGFASIIYKDAKKAPQASEIMKLTAQELFTAGLVDGVIAEGDRCFSDIARMLEKELGILGRMKSKELVNSRYDKFRNIDRGEIK